MIKIRLEALQKAASGRPAGYVDDVLASGTVAGAWVEIPEEAYSALIAKYRGASGQSPSGPGTELKALLKKVGITASPGCSCNKRAQLMDENESKEPGWCDKNLETICDWLQEEATKRKLPFIRMAARILVRQAIRNARKRGH